MRDWLRNGFCFGLGFILAKAAVAIVLFAGLLLFSDVASAQVRIPQVAVTYRLAIEREAARNFGIHGSEHVARLAAQVHQESGFRANAQSPYAQGLTQFTPATAKWLPQVCPAVGAPDPWDPQWALRAQACYMAWLHDRVGPVAWGDMRLSVDAPDSGATSRLKPGFVGECSRWNFALRAYNGGEGWLLRERKAAAKLGWNPNRWEEVDHVRVRAGWAHKENVHYPRVIMLRLEPAYIAAGWSGKAVC